MLILTGILFLIMIFMSIPICCYNKEKEETEKDVEEAAGAEDEVAALTEMLDWLLLEHESLLACVTSLDVETVHEAVKGWGTDDTALIRALCTRSKRALNAIAVGYRGAHDASLQELMEGELKGWYAYLAKFLVLQPSQSDALLLDLALEGATGDDKESVDRNALIEFLCARHPRRVRAAKRTWEKRPCRLKNRVTDEVHITKDFRGHEWTFGRDLPKLLPAKEPLNSPWTIRSIA